LHLRIEVHLNVLTFVSPKQHIDVWVDLMWAVRPSDADWAMAGGFFSASVMDGNIRSFWANGVKYPVPWCDVEKVGILYYDIFILHCY
jgi:hypothetical protein